MWKHSRTYRPPIGRVPKVFYGQYQSLQSPYAWFSTAKRVVLVVAVLAGGWLIYQAPIFRVSEVEIIGTDNPTIVSRLTSLKGQPILSHQVSSVPRDILHSDLSLTSLECRRGLPHTLKCEVAARQGIILWKLSSGEYLVDRTGFVYAKAGSDASGLLVVEDPLQPIQPLGERPFSSSLITQYLQMKNYLSQSGVAIDSLVMDSSSIYQVSARLSVNQFVGTDQAITLNGAVSALFNLTNSLDNQLRTLVAVLHEKGSLIKERIDLRVVGYVYYK